VGKTSLRKALRGVAHDEQEPETPGIERNFLPLSARKSNIRHIFGVSVVKNSCTKLTSSSSQNVAFTLLYSPVDKWRPASSGFAA
jgi:hypothetical protein